MGVFTIEQYFQFVLIGFTSGIFVGAMAFVIGLAINGIIKIFNMA